MRIVVVGQTDSMDLPGASNSYRGGTLDGLAVSIAVDASGSTAEYAHYVGGGDYEQVRDVAIFGDGVACGTGRMASTDFGVTSDAQQSSYGGGGMDSFLVCWDPSGATTYASYFGGTGYDVGYGLTALAGGDLVMSGRTASTNLPTTTGAYQTSYAGGNAGASPYFGGDYFAFRFAGSDHDVIWGSYVGGSADDAGRGRNDVGPSGQVWVGGRTQSSDFPVTTGGSLGGQSDGGVVRLSSDGSALEMGVFVGGSDPLDAATGGMLAMPDGSAYVCGYTNSADFPAPNGAAQSMPGGGFDGAVYHLAADGSVLAATYLGGSGYEECQGLAVDAEGSVYAVGFTDSSDFPFTSGSLSGSGDMYAVKMDAGLTSFDYAIPVGGSGQETADASRAHVVPGGGLLLVAASDSDDLPVTANALQGSRAGGQDLMIAIVNADGTGFDYMSYFGGTGDDFPRAVTVLP